MFFVTERKAGTSSEMVIQFQVDFRKTVSCWFYLAFPSILEIMLVELACCNGELLPIAIQMLIETSGKQTEMKSRHLFSKQEMLIVWQHYIAQPLFL